MTLFKLWKISFWIISVNENEIVIRSFSTFNLQGVFFFFSVSTHSWCWFRLANHCQLQHAHTAQLSNGSQTRRFICFKNRIGFYSTQKSQKCGVQRAEERAINLRHNGLYASRRKKEEGKTSLRNKLQKTTKAVKTNVMSSAHQRR